MRGIEEITIELDNVKAQINGLREKKESLMCELAEAVSVRFEAEIKVKHGDLIKNSSYGTLLFYDGIVQYLCSICVLCHPVKKDGTASKSARYLLLSDFGFNIHNYTYMV